MAWVLDESEQPKGGKWILDETAHAPSTTDPTAASLGMFAPGQMQTPTTEQLQQGATNLYDQMPTKQDWIKGGLGMIPPILGTVGGAIGAGTGLLTGGATSIPGAMGGAALGAGIGESARQGLSQMTGLEPPATLKENIGNVVQQAIMGGGSAAIPGGQGWIRPMLAGSAVMGGSEAAKQGVTGEYDIGKVGKMAGLGLGVGALGEGISRGIDKLFFGEVVPLAEKAGSQFVEFAKKHKLPYSIDAIETKPSLSLGQAYADWGPGTLITNWQRGKLIEKTTQLSKAINEELGLIPPSDIHTVADKLAEATKTLVTKSKTHADWNIALGKLPENTRIDAQNLMDTVDKIGGMKAIEELFLRTGHTSRIGTAINRVYARDGEYDKRDLEYIINNINIRYRQLYGENNWEGANNIKALKAAIMEDIAYVQLPELQTTLKAIRAANDNAYSSARIMLSSYPILGKLLTPSANKTQITLSLFNDSNVPAIMSLRNKLINSEEGKNVWELLQSSYLRKVFDNTLVSRPDFNRKVFDPGKYLDWYEKYGRAASTIMSDIAPALQQWEQVSQGMLKDYGRKTSTLSALKMAGASVGIGGAGGMLAAGPVGMVAIPGFSILAALGTMGPGNWGFIRNSLTKQAAQPISMGSRLLSIPPQMEAMEAAK